MSTPACPQNAETDVNKDFAGAGASLSVLRLAIASVYAIIDVMARSGAGISVRQNNAKRSAFRRYYVTQDRLRGTGAALPGRWVGLLCERPGAGLRPHQVPQDFLPCRA
jgi:hypothetical protein